MMTKGVEDLVTSDNKKVRKCTIAILVLWGMLVTCILTLLGFQFSIFEQEIRVVRLDLGIKESWYVRRTDWQALPDKGIESLNLPASHVLIGHSELDNCTEKHSCIPKILEIQRLHQVTYGWNDIGPNYLVGGNGLVFEGRGANVLGAMVKTWNRICISVMFVGDYRLHEPSMVQFEHVTALLNELVRLRVLREDYILYGHCQVNNTFASPGANVVDKLSNFEHWNSTNQSLCKS